MGFHRDMTGGDLHAPSNERVENNTGNTIPALRCATFNSIGIAYPEVTIATTVDQVRGITQTNIPTGEQGYITTLGLLNNVNTSSWAPGTKLYCANVREEIVLDAIPDAGQFTLEFNGDTTGVILFTDNAATIQALIEGLPSVSGSVTVSIVDNGVADTRTISIAFLESTDDFSSTNNVTLTNNTLLQVATPVVETINMIEDGRVNEFQNGLPVATVLTQDPTFGVIYVNLAIDVSIGAQAIQNLIVVNDTNSIAMTEVDTATTLEISADLRISPVVADAGNTIIANDIQLDGLRSQVAHASGAIEGSVNLVAQQFEGLKTLLEGVSTKTENIRAYNATGVALINDKVVKMIGRETIGAHDIPQVGYLTSSVDVPVGIITTNPANTTEFQLLKRGFYNSGFNSTGAVVGDKVYADASGDLTLTQLGRPSIGQVLTVGPASIIYVNIGASSGIPVTSFSLPFVNGDWVLLGGFYYIDVVHNLELSQPQVEVWEGLERVELSSIQSISANTVRINVLADPDLRFDGTVIVLK